jgi:tetratricopeptide (TPR) repeat protein
LKKYGENSMDRNRVVDILNNYQHNILKPEDDKRAFYLGNCYVQLRDNAEAQRQYERSIIGMLGPKKLWKDTGQVDWLVDICVLSGRKDLYPDVLRELELYKKIPSKGDSALAYYVYGVMELLYPSGWDISTSINNLLKRPKWKLTYAIGQVLQSIIDDNLLALNNSLLVLLKVHDGMVKHGALRETAEGLICMQAMSLTFAALKRNLKVEIENDYLPMGYLNFVLKNTT